MVATLSLSLGTATVGQPAAALLHYLDSGQNETQLPNQKVGTLD